MESKLQRIAVATSKGGVGKTTIATNLAAGLALKGRRVLLIDCDAQGNLQNQFHIRTEKTLVDLLVDGTVDVAGVRPNLDLINSGKQRLAEAELVLSGRASRESLLAERLHDLNGYDFVFCDLSPTITLANAMALHFCDYLIVPVSMSFYAITGAIQILETVEADSASSIQLLGLVLNCFDSRTHLARMVTEAVREKWGGRVFDTVIRKNVSIEEAPSQRKTIYEHAPSSRGAEDFELLTDEFLRRLSL
jgi:chromosome partitioning protein